MARFTVGTSRQMKRKRPGRAVKALKRAERAIDIRRFGEDVTKSFREKRI